MEMETIKIKINNKLMQSDNVTDLSYIVTTQIIKTLGVNANKNYTSERLAIKSVLLGLQARDNYLKEISEKEIDASDYHDYCNNGVYEFKLMEELSPDGLVPAHTLDLSIQTSSEPKLLLIISVENGELVLDDEGLSRLDSYILHS
jgi:hypothetical protein